MSGACRSFGSSTLVRVGVGGTATHNTAGIYLMIGRYIGLHYERLLCLLTNATGAALTGLRAGSLRSVAFSPRRQHGENATLGRRGCN